MTAPLRFLLLVIAGWIALRVWVTGEPILDHFGSSPPVRLAAGPATSAAGPAPTLAAAPATPLEIAAVAAAAAAQAAAAAASAADAAAAAAEAASIAAEAAAAAAGVPVIRRAGRAVARVPGRQLALAEPSGRWRQAAVHRASARHFRQEERDWSGRAAPRRTQIASPIASPIVPRDGDWSPGPNRTMHGAFDHLDREPPVPAPATLASSSLPPLPSPNRSSLPDQTAAPEALTLEAATRRDRLRMTGWLLWRPAVGTSSLASGATLGDSQAGARLAFDLRPSIAASLRAYAPLRRSKGGEVAAGLSWAPSRSLPLRITGERRQRIGSGGGRSAFALFAEGGFYHRPLPLEFRLNGYAQGGVVGIVSRDLFIDGALTFDRPLIGPLRAGGGVWGGAQPGANRLDLGPRLSLLITRGARVGLDWRTRVVGSARPGSGPALTIAGDF